MRAREIENRGLRASFDVASRGCTGSTAGPEVTVGPTGEQSIAP
jgi:hypothetical protein